MNLPHEEPPAQPVRAIGDGGPTLNDPIDTASHRDDDESMKSITVRLFGPLAELGGGREIAIQVRADARVHDAVDAAIDHLPALADWKNLIAVADDDDYLPAHSSLGDRTSICLIPPVSGG